MILAKTREIWSSGFLTKSDTNWPVQSQKQARCLKVWLEVEVELYYPSSENKGADQLRSFCEADLRLCFRIGKYPVFSWHVLFKELALHGAYCDKFRVTSGFRDLFIGC